MGGTPPVPFDPNPEYQNPTRRYKAFRPRQAYRGVITLATPTNNATLSLYNSGSGPQVLVVRAFTVAPTTAKSVFIAREKGSQGSSGGLIQPVMGATPAGPGQLFSLDTATALTPDYLATPQSNSPIWPYEFPVDVLVPGHSLVFQDTTAAEAFSLAILWEAITVEELDFAW